MCCVANVRNIVGRFTISCKIKRKKRKVAQSDEMNGNWSKEKGKEKEKEKRKEKGNENRKENGNQKRKEDGKRERRQRAFESNTQVDIDSRMSTNGINKWE